MHEGRSGDLTVKKDDSPLWAFICNQKELIDNGSIWQVRNGEQVSFFKDCWVKQGMRLIDDCNMITNIDTDSKVCDWTDHGYWDTRKMVTILPKEVINSITAKMPPSLLFGEDVRSWVGTRNGEFTIKSAYFMLEGYQNSSVSQVLKAIWKWRGVERIRVFLWIAIQDRLLTNYRRSKWSGSSPYCCCCTNDIETTLHVLRDCIHARSVWDKMVNPNKKLIFYSLTLMEWFAFNLENEVGSLINKPWNETWGVAVWKLWNWRNQSIFNENFSRPYDPCLFIISMRKNLTFSIAGDAVTGGQATTTRTNRWRAPNEGWVKLNTDGAVNKEGRAGCGGVIRNSVGLWIGGFMHYIGNCNPHEAEEWDILKGLETA